MSEPVPHVSDELFAQHLVKMGGASSEQIDKAKARQKEFDGQGRIVTLADVLVEQGIITSAMRENVEKKVHLVKLGGHSQLGSYKLIKKIGEGGMGAVYLAEDTLKVGTKVALKVLPEKHANDIEFVTRFKREARATSNLHHENIVSASEIGEQDGAYFYAMEYCEGESLDSKLARAVFLAWQPAMDIILQVARGLQCAHEHGFVHRDIKPANIFITKNGRAKILDLGLTKNIADTEQSFNTMTGIALGTPHYISPEQAKGAKDIDGRSDIYSLGATLYQLVTGRTPFDGHTAALIMMKHLSEELPNPQDLRDGIPDGVVQVIQKMMAKEPYDRYENCAALIADLELVLAGRSPSNTSLGIGKSSVAMRASRPVAVSAAHVDTLVRQPAAGSAAAIAGTSTLTAPAANSKSKGMLFVFLGAGTFAVLLTLILLSGGLGGKGVADQKAGDTKGGKEPDLTGPGGQPLTELKYDEAWTKKAQSLTGQEQIFEVLKKLRELNPKFDVTKWSFSFDSTGKEVLSVQFQPKSGATNLTPVLAFPKLEALAFDFDPARDKALLKAIKNLKQVNGQPVEVVLKRESPMESTAPSTGSSSGAPVNPGSGSPGSRSSDDGIGGKLKGMFK